jgi:hypothetical protein
VSESAVARFGLALTTLLFGAISVIWHDSDLWKHAHQIGGPLAAVLAWACAALLCVGGLILLVGRNALGSVVLGIGGTLLTLSCIADIAPGPFSFPNYIDFFELAAIVCGAAAVYAPYDANAARATMLRRASLVGFGICNISYAAAQVVFFKYTASLIPSWIPGASFWTALTTLAFALAAVAMLIDRLAALALRLLATMVALFALLVWVPQLLAAPTLPNWSEFMLTWVIAAAAWTLAAARPAPAA